MKRDYFHLSIPQQNIWNLQTFYPDTSITNLCGVVFYKETRRDEWLEQAINQVIRSHTGLRMRFSEINGEIKQYIENYAYIKIPVRKFSSCEDFEDYAIASASLPVKLTEKTMYYFEIIHVKAYTGVLVMLNHLIADAWTYSLVGKGIDQFYKELETGGIRTEKVFDYIDFVKSEDLYLESSRFGKDRIFWQEKYKDKPEITSIRAGFLSSTSIASKRYCKSLDKALTKNIRNFTEKTGITEAVLFETVLAIYLSRINPENRTITIGVPVLNRRNIQEKNTIGMFISTMPLTVKVSQQDSAVQVAKKIATEQGNVFRHQKYPYSRILEDIRARHDFSGNLYEVMVSYQNAQIDKQSFTKWFSNGSSEVPFMFHIDNRDMNDSYTVNVDYQTEVFGQEEEIPLIVYRLETILNQIIENKDVFLRDIFILPEKEQRKVLLDFNRTSIDFRKDVGIHELFMEQAEKTPEKTALVFQDQCFSYKQLDEMSNSLAFVLRKKGIGPNKVVPIISKRSWHVIVAMLGILKAGGAYMPVAPDYPKSKIQHILEISKADLILTYEFRETLEAETMDLNEFDYKKHSSRICEKGNLENLCYVIFTSGSTGEPKGISLCHRNVINYIQNHPQNRVCHQILSRGFERIVSVTNIIFDIFVTESLLPLLYGMTVYFADEKEVYQQSKLSQLIQKNRIEVIQATPTKMRSYLEEESNLEYLKELKVIILGGEALTKDLYTRIRHDTDAKIFNIYGPAETTVWSANKEVIWSDDITIGKPIANTQIYILDKEQKLLPIGIAGELCIAGDGVGKGYLGNKKLTEEKFVKNPFATKENGHGQMMYHTGDLACWRADGEIAYLGRTDMQIKIRGLRIELEEIESCISSFSGVKMAAVMDKRDCDNRQYLAGYYTTDQEIDENELRQYVSSRLPQYMVPNYFIRLKNMPMTASGKTDRRNLPEPEVAVSIKRKINYIAPQTDTEKAVAVIWKRLMHLENVGKKDDFWELGGDSLLAIKVLNHIETQFHVEITVKDVMEYSSLERLAAHIEQCGKKTNSIPVYWKRKYLILPQQKAIYAVCKKDPESLIYNMPAEIYLPENIDRERLKKCIVRVVDRHKSLKTYIKAETDGLYGVYDEAAQIEFEEYTEETKHEFIRAFDMGRAPLMRVGFTEHLLLFDIHHIIADGFSINIILQGIKTAYEKGETDGEEITYSDYAEYCWKKDFTKHKEYFKSMLVCDFEPVSLPACKESNEHKGSLKIYRLSKSTEQAVKKFIQDKGLTETMVFFGAYAILLSKFTRRTDILGSIVLSNRRHKEIQNTVGMFVNTLPVYFQVNGKTSEYFQKIKNLIWDLFEYQELPFTEIADYVGMKDKTVVNTSFVYHGDGEMELSLDGKVWEIQSKHTQTTKFDLTIEVIPLKKEYCVKIEYDRTKYGELMIARLFEAYDQILSHLSEEQLENISIISEKENRKIRIEFNNTKVEYERGRCVHELFQEQVKRVPEQIALIFEKERFTYKQLDTMSNSLAHILREKGIKPNDIVPIIAKRSWHVIVAMLGILKAGGGFLLVDYQYPVKRIDYLLEECQAKIVFSCGSDYPNSLDLEKIPYEKDTMAVNNLNCTEDIFCVIHTSGSTGMPKVTALTHSNVTHFIRYSLDLFQGAKQVISTTIITFDAFIQETIAALCNQVTVVFLNEIQMTNQAEFENVIMNYEDSFLFQTPTKLLNYIRNSTTGDFLKKIHTFVIGGEMFPEELYEKIRRYNLQCRVFNGYGPTETTLCVIDKEIQNSNSITIGKPILNTQIYILDKNKKILPIGVPGELCIAGDGVGKGYLNRPELTEERFVPNPFATKENGHGRVMYHTGDLACWNEKGEIEFLGRIDTQVKIRGLRIELREIESVMNQFPEIQMAAVEEKRDDNNRQYLVGYYVAKQELNKSYLRRQLGKSLPKYMIPNYFMKLDSMPMTLSGKIDRKNLPIPEFVLYTEKYAAPKTEREKVLSNLFATVLKTGRIGMEDDFFEMGGDSLKAIELVAKAHQAGQDITLQSVFDYPTVKDLCYFLDKGKRITEDYEQTDFTRFESLLKKNTIEEAFIPEKKDLGNILLTGATGFLGIHILDALMKAEDGIIYCLIREGTGSHGQERLRERLRYYFGDLYENEWGKRIIPVFGDLEHKRILEKPVKNVKTVIHSAANVSHYGLYEDFYRINVQGTQNAVSFAQSINARFIHISTLSVGGDPISNREKAVASEGKIEFNETSFFVGQCLDNVYIRSKFEGEKVVFQAMAEGLDTKIIRVGNLTNRVSDYKFQPNYTQNAFLSKIKAIIEFGMFPDSLLHYNTEFSPVDLTAEGIVKIARYAKNPCVFHLNNHSVKFSWLIDSWRDLGINIKIVSGNVFNQELDKTMKDVNTEYIFEALQNDGTREDHFVYRKNVLIKNDFTLWFLKQTGFQWKETDFEYIRGYVKYFQDMGYLSLEKGYLCV